MCSEPFSLVTVPDSFSLFASRMAVFCSHLLLKMADHHECSLVPFKQPGGMERAWDEGWVVLNFCICASTYNNLQFVNIFVNISIP